MNSVVNIEECLRNLTEIAAEIEVLQTKSEPATAEEVLGQLAKVVDLLAEIHRPAGDGMF